MSDANIMLQEPLNSGVGIKMLAHWNAIISDAKPSVCEGAENK